MSITLSQLREFLAEVQDAYGDIEVKFPAMVDADNDEADTVSISGISTQLDENDQPEFVLICDAYTLDGITSSDVIN